MAFGRSVLALAVMLVALPTLCGATEIDYPKSPVPTREEFEAIEQKANAGDAESQLYLGVFYANGDRVEQDYSQAAQWYRLAAAQGNARAQRYLGLLLSVGVGIERDRKEAYDWFVKADKAGDLAAGLEISAYPLFYRELIMSYVMGNFNDWRLRAFALSGQSENIPSFEECFWRKYNDWNGPYQDDSKLVKVIEERADGGDDESQVDMVKFHILGQGVPVDVKEIEKWLLLAVKAENPYAQFMYGYSRGNSFFKSPDRKESFELLRKAASSNAEPFFSVMQFEAFGPVGPYLYSEMVADNSESFEESVKKIAALKLYAEFKMKTLKELSNRGYVLAHYLVAKELSATGEEWAPEAFRFFELAFEGGMIAAKIELMKCYALGIGTTADYPKALGYFKEITANSTMPQWQMIESCLEATDPQERRVELFTSWLKKEALNGDVNAQLMLALLCGSPQEEEQAKKWLVVAALKGSGPAYSELTSKFRDEDEALEVESALIAKGDEASITDLLNMDIYTLKKLLNTHILMVVLKDAPVEKERMRNISFPTLCFWAAGESGFEPVMIYYPNVERFLMGDFWWKKDTAKSNIRSVINDNLLKNKDKLKIKYLSVGDTFEEFGSYPSDYF